MATCAFAATGGPDPDRNRVKIQGDIEDTDGDPDAVKHVFATLNNTVRDTADIRRDRRTHLGCRGRDWQPIGNPRFRKRSEKPWRNRVNQEAGPRADLYKWVRSESLRNSQDGVLIA